MIYKTKHHLDCANKGVQLMLAKSGVVLRNIKLREKLESISTLLRTVSTLFTDFERDAENKPKAEGDLLFSMDNMVLADQTNTHNRDDDHSDYSSYPYMRHVSYPESNKDQEGSVLLKNAKVSADTEDRAPLGKRRQLKSAKPISDFDDTKQEAISNQESESKWEGSTDEKGRKRNSRGKRGSYRKYNETIKKKAIELAERVRDPTKAAKTLGIPSKNLKRWIVSGPVRKKGGRKTQDPEMERRLMKWIEDYKMVYHKLPSTRDIKDNARAFSSCRHLFKASKGWLEKFLLRHGLAQKRKPAFHYHSTKSFLDTHKLSHLDPEIFIKMEHLTKLEDDTGIPLNNLGSSIPKSEKLDNEFRLNDD